MKNFKELLIWKKGIEVAQVELMLEEEIKMIHSFIKRLSAKS